MKYPFAMRTSFSWSPLDRGAHLPFLSLMLLFIFSVVGGTYYTLQRLRHESVAFQKEIAATQTRALEDQLTQSLIIIDLMLANVGDRTAAALQSADLNARLHAELRRSPLIRSLSLVDDQLRITASSNPANIGLSLAVDDYLPHIAAGESDPALRFGLPWTGRDFADGHVAGAPGTAAATDSPGFFPVLRRVERGNGVHYVVATLNPDYFLNLFAKALNSENASARLLRIDGALMLSTDETELPGRRLEGQALHEIRRGQEFGSYDDASRPDQPTLTTFRVSAQYPLFIVDDVDYSLVLRDWSQERRQLLLLILPALLGVVIVATGVYVRQIRLARAQALAQQQEHQRLETVLNAVSVNLVLLDASGRIVMGNAGWKQLLQDARADLEDHGTGCDFASLCAQVFTTGIDLNTWLCEGIGQVLSHATDRISLQYAIHFADGTRWFDVVVHAVREPGVVGAVVMQMDVSDKVQARFALEEFNRDFESFLNQTTDFIYFKDHDGRIRFCSQTLATITGHAHWRELIGKTSREIFPADVAQVYEAEERPIFLDGKPLLNRIDPYYDAAGQPGFVQTSKWPLFDTEGQVVGIFGISRDVTGQRQIEERLQLAATVFTHAREGIMITDAQGTIVDVNETFTRITGYTREESIGNNPRMLKSGRHGPEHYATMWHNLKRDGYWFGEVWNRRKNGEIIAEIQTVSSVRDMQGQIRNYVSLFSDITAMKLHEQQLKHIAHYDVLTQLPNRLLLADRLQQSLIQSQRRKRAVAVAFLDLDGFKSINDMHGHDTGDALLIAVAQRLTAVMREGDTLARIGGDEFVAVLVDLNDEHDCEKLLQRMLHAASDPWIHNELMLQVSASVGVTLYPQDRVDADLLMRHADQAMYIAKHSGKNRYHFFDVAEDSAFHVKRRQRERVRQALENHELVLFYQPKINMHTLQLVGAEALIRWQHPDRGLLGPADFLPMIDNDDLANTVGDWVIETALSQLDAWRQAGLMLTVSVNLGAHQLQHSGFVKRLQALLSAFPGLTPQQLELELLESSALDDIVKVSTVMHACRALGVRFALDDFGTGYSSLTYLRRLPADILKIDQSFVRGMLNDPNDFSIVEGVIGLAGAFRREVVAEGVETQAHGALLRQLGCQLAQGYGIAHPMSAQAFQGWHQQWLDEPRWAA